MTEPDRPAPAALPAVRTADTAVAAVPAQLRDIARVAGREAAVALIAAKGGTEIWIPRHAGPEHWLSLLIGEAMAERVCAFYRTTNADGREVGSVRIYVPLVGTGILAEARRSVVVDVVEHHLSVREAARRARITERAAHAILRRIGDNRQGDLFAPRDDRHGRS